VHQTFATGLEGSPLALETLLDAIPSPIFFKDAAGVYRGCNRAFEQYLGRDRSEILGRTVDDIAPPELAAVYRRADEALLREPGVQVYETSIRCADGRELEVVFHKATFADAQGRVAGLIGTYLDITDRKRAERALRQSEERLQLALDATDQAWWDWDVRTDAIVVGPQVRRLLGRDPAELATSAGVGAIVHPEDLPRAKVAFGAHLTGGMPSVEVECRLRHQGGEWRWFLVAARCVERDAAGPRRIVGTSVEITRAKQMHERIVLADRLASLGTLTAGLSHEINNPLAVVVSSVAYAGQALRKLAAVRCGLQTCDVVQVHPVLCEVDAALADAEQSAERVGRIVQDLRVFSRARGPEEPVDLREVARRSVSLARGQLKGRGDVVLDLEPVAPVMGDTARLGQVVVNLLVNAAHALPAGGGVIRVATRTAADGRVALDVIDDGCGISRDALSRVFDPFYTTKPAGDGTGLGLFVCHNIVTGLGGELAVESEPGRGSTFTVLLPAVPAAERAPEVAVAPDRPRARVLVVDDDPAVARAIRRAVSDAHEVTTESSGPAALARLAAGETFDAVLCDVMMPGMDGGAVLERLREVAPALARRVVLVTGAFNPDVQAIVERSGVPYVLKPFSAAELLDAIDATIAVPAAVR
jgi:PAS domain S-box-containing protein